MPSEPLRNTLSRALKVFVALSSTRFGLTFNEILEEVGCSRRTLYRYLNALEDSGIHIVVSMREQGQIARQILEVNGRRLRVIAGRKVS